jgi:hypothetical protein
MYTPKSRHGFPPERDRDLPEAVPWDRPIHELTGLWLVIRCGGCGGGTEVPLRLMAAEHGWNLTLRTIVPKLRCRVESCRARPSKVELVKNPADQGFKVGRPQRALNLLD